VPSLTSIWSSFIISSSIIITNSKFILS